MLLTVRIIYINFARIFGSRALHRETLSIYYETVTVLPITGPSSRDAQVFFHAPADLAISNVYIRQSGMMQRTKDLRTGMRKALMEAFATVIQSHCQMQNESQVYRTCIGV